MSAPLRLSHTSIASFLRCPRLWYLEHVLRLSPVGDRSRALGFGTAFHAALEQWWTADGSDEARLAASFAAFQLSGEQLSFEDGCLGPELLLGYAATYANDELRAHSIPLGECKIEVPVLDPDGNVAPDMVLVAKLDEIGFELGGETVLVEHKTTSSDINSSTFWSRFDTSLQLPIYFIAAADCGRLIDSCILDVIRAPKMQRRLATPIEKREFYKRAIGDAAVGDPKPGTRLRDETREEFAVRAREAVLANPGDYYARKVYRMTEEQLLAARGDIYATGKLMQAAIAAEGATPRNSDGCVRFNSQCGFHASCYGGASLQDSQLYQVRSTH